MSHLSESNHRKRSGGQGRWLLAAILCVAAALRLVALGSNPPGLFRDEAEKGYTAWSLAKTGGYTGFDMRDAPPRFHSWPLFIQTLGALTSATYHYLDAPFVGLFGPSEFMIRLPAALAGLLGVWLCHGLALALTADRRIALLSAALLAVSPWQLVFSRWAAQGILVPVFVSAGVWMFWSVKDRRQARVLWPLAALALAAGAYTYAPARLCVPLLALCVAICARRRLRDHPAPAVVSALLFAVPAVALILFQIGGGGERFGRVSIFSPESSWIASGWLLIRNYLSHFSPGYLFLSGDAEARHSLPGFGQMLLIEAPLFLAGVVVMIRRRRSVDWLLLAWFLIGPIPASLTGETPHALRSITALPSPSIISAVGFFALWDGWRRRLGDAFSVRSIRFQRRGLSVAMGLLFALNAAVLAYTLFAVYPASSARRWQYGLKQAFAKVREQGGPDRQPPFVFLSGQIILALQQALVYERTDPVRFRDEGLKALRPVAQLLPRPLGPYYERAPSGTWFILKPWERIPAPPVDAVYYPAKPFSDEPPRPAFLLYYKP